MTNCKTRIKLATWNVAQQVSQSKWNELRIHLNRIASDLLVLTETQEGFDPGYENHFSSEDGVGTDAGAGLHWASIWSNDSLERLKTSDNLYTLATRVMPQNAEPFIVYATVLPWLGSKWRDYPSTDGVAFQEALNLQKADWLEIRTVYPDDELFVLGDFNQDLASFHYYGSKKNRLALENALLESGLIALTAGENDPIARPPSVCACIDHICMLRESRWQLTSTERWPDEEKPPKSLSDHFGVAVSLTAN